MSALRHFTPQSDMSNKASSASPEQQDQQAKARALEARNERRRTQNKNAQTRFREKRRLAAAAAAATDDDNATSASNLGKRYAKREKEVRDNEGEDQACHPKRAKTGAQPDVQPTRMITRSMGLSGDCTGSLSSKPGFLRDTNKVRSRFAAWMPRAESVISRTPRTVSWIAFRVPCSSHLGFTEQQHWSREAVPPPPTPPQFLGGIGDDAATEVVSSHPSSVAGNPDEVIPYSPSSVLLPLHQAEYPSQAGDLDLGFETFAPMQPDVSFNFAQANMDVGVPTGMGLYDTSNPMPAGLDSSGQDTAVMPFLTSWTGLGSGLARTPHMTSPEISPAMPYTSLTPPRPSECTSSAPPRPTKVSIDMEGNPTSNEGPDIDSLLHNAIELKKMQFQCILNQQEMQFIAMGITKGDARHVVRPGLGITGFGYMR
ncbi:MAG: hypothetical protein M1816_004287 [Peltula sp. TS41687]|nr:MAG: hypothetical protein M1816_004287 [Peltula sp. TS41687]